MQDLALDDRFRAAKRRKITATAQAVGRKWNESALKGQKMGDFYDPILSSVSRNRSCFCIRCR